MTNLGGHDIETLTEAFRAQDAAGDQPTCFIAYTIKGMGLPFAGHKDNHAGLMTKEQMEGFRREMRIRDGHEWDRFEGLDLPRRSCAPSSPACPSPRPLAPEGRGWRRPTVPVPAAFPAPRVPAGRKMSTQAAFGEILAEIGRGQGEAAATGEAHRHHQPGRDRLHQSRPLGEPARHLRPAPEERRLPRRQAGLRAALGHVAGGPAYRARHRRAEPVPAAVARWACRIACYGARLLPIGTVYDPFVNRGLDALIYACYQDARFLLVSTPSGLTLAPEGGQHQSVNTPLIGMAQDRLASFEPAHADELAILMRYAFEHMQKPDGSAVWLRLSTRGLEQPARSSTRPR